MNWFHNSFSQQEEGSNTSIPAQPPDHHHHTLFTSSTINSSSSEQQLNARMATGQAPAGHQTNFGNRCQHCGCGDCDLKIDGCGCTLHVRCTRLNRIRPLDVCGYCRNPMTEFVLFPLSLEDTEEEAQPSQTSTSRKRSGTMDSNQGEEDKPNNYLFDLRCGRWTDDELAYAEKIIAKFQTGELPIVEGVRLNDYLGDMLKSKQSRLLKKMKNAKLAAKKFECTTGFLSATDAQELALLEKAFVNSLEDTNERTMMRIHLQKEWREGFSRLCAAIGQPVDVEDWLDSMAEMDRRESEAKIAIRTAKRKRLVNVTLPLTGNTMSQEGTLGGQMMTQRVNNNNAHMQAAAPSIPIALSGQPQLIHVLPREDDSVTNQEIDDHVMNQLLSESELNGSSESSSYSPHLMHTTANETDMRIAEIVSLLGEHMPADSTCPSAAYMPGFVSLRLWLLCQSKWAANQHVLRIVLESYSSYVKVGRHRAEIASMLARDFMFLTSGQKANIHHSNGGQHHHM